MGHIYRAHSNNLQVIRFIIRSQETIPMQSFIQNHDLVVWNCPNNRMTELEVSAGILNFLSSRRDCEKTSYVKCNQRETFQETLATLHFWKTKSFADFSMKLMKNMAH